MAGTHNRYAALAATIATALAGACGIGQLISPAHAAAATEYALETYIANVGGQEQLNACTGGLTNMAAVSNYLTKVEGTPKLNLPIHNECGGQPILGLEEGDKVLIDGLGEFEVVAERTVLRGGTAKDLIGLPGSVLLQTCHDTGNEMRVVALEPIA